MMKTFVVVLLLGLILSLGCQQPQPQKPVPISYPSVSTTPAPVKTAPAVPAAPATSASQRDEARPPIVHVPKQRPRAESPLAQASVASPVSDYAPTPEAVQKPKAQVPAVAKTLSASNAPVAPAKKEIAKGEKKEAALAGAPKEARPAKSEQGETYHLRVIALPQHSYYEKMTQKIVAYFQKHGIAGAVARASGKYWVVDIGTFPSNKSPQAMAMLDRVRQMQFDGLKQFQDAYYVAYR